MNLCTLLGAFIQTQKTKSYKNNKSTPAHSSHINIRVQKWTFKLDINNRIASVTVSGVLLYISPIPYNCIEFSITSTGQISTRTTIIHMGSMNHRHIVSKISDGKRIQGAFLQLSKTRRKRDWIKPLPVYFIQKTE